MERPLAGRGDVQPDAPYTTGLGVGRVVHYVMTEPRANGAHRPAIVVRVWNTDPGTVQLQVFTDESNDGLVNTPVIWRTSVMPDPAGEKPGTWHWPERV